MPDWELYQEAHRRGILPPEKAQLYSEAIQRGLIPGVNPQNKENELSWGDVASGAVDNFLPSAKRAAGEIWDAVTSPVETVKALGNLGLGTAQKLIPGEQEEEKYADAVGQYFADRYGSMDGFKKSLMLDPAGVLSDMSSVFTGGGALLKGAGKAATVAGAAKAGGAMEKAAGLAGKAATATDPLTASIQLTGMGVDKALGGLGMAERLYESALKPSTTLSPAERANITATGLRERISPTAGGYAKAEKIIDDLNSQIAGDIGKATEQGVTIDPNGIANKAFDGAYDRFSKQVAPTADVNTVYDTINDFLANHGREPLTAQAAQNLKVGTYKVLKDKAYKGDTLKSAGVETEKALARELKDAIAEKVPPVGPLNARESDLFRLMSQVERATGRSSNWNIFSLPSVAVGGAALDALGPGAAGGLAALMNAGRSPAVKSNLAFALNEGTIPRAMHNAAASGYAAGSTEDILSRAFPNDPGKRAILQSIMGQPRQ